MEKSFAVDIKIAFYLRHLHKTLRPLRLMDIKNNYTKNIQYDLQK